MYLSLVGYGNSTDAWRCFKLAYVNHGHSTSTYTVWLAQEVRAFVQDAYNIVHYLMYLNNYLQGFARDPPPSAITHSSPALVVYT
jgi:hypothetical protein